MLNDILLNDYIQATVSKALEPEMIIEHDFPEDDKITVFCPCGGSFGGERGDVDFCPHCGSTLNVE